MNIFVCCISCAYVVILRCLARSYGFVLPGILDGKATPAIVGE